MSSKMSIQRKANVFRNAEFSGDLQWEHSREVLMSKALFNFWEKNVNITLTFAFLLTIHSQLPSSYLWLEAMNLITYEMP